MHEDAGFTLVEMLTALAVVAVLLTVGLPSLGDALARHQVRTVMHLISADLAMARNSAIMRRSPVVACPRTETLRCRSDADWSQGWIVFADPDGNRQPDAESDLLRVSNAPSGDGPRLGATRNFIRYQRDGRSAGTNLTVHICSRGDLAGQVVVSNLGRVRSARPTRPTPCPL